MNGRNRAAPTLFWLGIGWLFGSGCAPDHGAKAKDPREATSTSTVSVALPGSAAPRTARNTSPSESGEQLLAEFLAGERRLPAGPGPSYLVGKRPGACTALPAKRPAAFHISYTHVAAGDLERPVLPTWYAVGENECEILWSLLHIGVPSVVCARYTPRVLDEFYQNIRALSPHDIRTVPADRLAAIHRGGVSVFWHWPGHACEISDEGASEVVPADERRFRELVSWMQGASPPKP